MPAADPASISVVIVNWNGRAMLAECLRSLEAQTDRDFEVVVVDNGSSDGSIEMLRREHACARCIEAGANLGFAEGVNRGIAASRGAWIATLNNDTVADRRWIEELRAAAAAAEPGVGMLQSRLVFRHAPGRTNSTGVVLFGDGTARDRDFDAPSRAGDTPEEVFCPTAGAALYRRAMLEETRLPTGVFDRTFFMYLEDVDLGWRCRLAGWTATYVPSAVVQHAFQASSRRHGDRFMSLLLRYNRVRMLLKNGSILLCARTAPRTVLDLCEAVAWSGPSALSSFARAARDGAGQRSAVRRAMRSPRRAVERRWVAPPPPEQRLTARAASALAALARRLAAGPPLTSIR